MAQPRRRTVVIGTATTLALVAGGSTAYAAITGPVDGPAVPRRGGPTAADRSRR